MEKEIDDLLKDILGDNAFNNDMKVESDVSRLVKTVNYLVTQLNITSRWCNDEVEHIQSVLKSTKEILKD